MIYFLDHSNFIPSISFDLSSHLWALQKIQLASHIRCMADLLHVVAIQQLEVAVLGSPTAQVVNLLAHGLVPSSIVAALAQPCTRAYTSTPLVPPPPSVPIVGVTTTSLELAIVSTSGGDKLAPPKSKLPISDISDDLPHHHITPTPIDLSSLVSTTSSASDAVLPVVVVSELAIPAEAYPEWINRPSGGKDYLCCLCPFRHSKLDSILTHVRKHLEVVIVCPICGKVYQNTASLHKYGRDVYSIHIASTTPLPSFIPRSKFNYTCKVVVYIVLPE